MQNYLTRLLDDLEGFHFLRDLEREKMQASVSLRPMNQSFRFEYTVFYVFFTDLFLCTSYFLMLFKVVFLFQFLVIYCWYIEM